MRGRVIVLASSLALLLAGNAWAGKDEAKAKAGSGGAAAEHQSEKALERSNAQWKDSAQKGAERADSVKSKGAKAKGEADALAKKHPKSPGKRDEGTLER